VPLKKYLHLLGYAAPYRRGWLLIVGVTLLSTALSLLQPWPMKIVIDHVLAREPVSDTLAKVIALLPGGSTPEGLLGWMVLTTLAFVALNSAAEVILTRSWILTGQGMVYDLSRDLFAHLQRRSLYFHSRNSVGDAMSRITTDSWSVYTLADTMLIGPGRALVMIVGIVTVMAQMDIGLTLLSFTIAPFLVWTSFLIGRTIRAVAREARESESRIQSQVQRTLSGMSVVQAFGQEEREQLRFENFTTQAIRVKQRGTVVGGLYGLSSGLVTTF
jgi:ATP-binding cassette subfamily B protein